MKLATWNVNSIVARLPRLLAWLQDHPVDLLALQETKVEDAKFPHAELQAAGWQATIFGQRTYNGVALVSRQPLTQVVRNIPGHEDPQARVLSAHLGPLRIVGAYVPNGQAPGSDKFAYKLAWLDAFGAWLRREQAEHRHLVVMGDFNIAPEDRDVHDPVAWAGQILCTDEERQHFRAWLELGLVDAFRLFEQPPKTFSWWDYRMLGFPKNKGLRIDHILVSAALAPRVQACRIDREARKGERPSDHAPVLVELEGP